MDYDAMGASTASSGSSSTNGGVVGNWIENIFERGRQDYWTEQTQQWNEEKEKRDYDRQKEFAQFGIRWKVQDAMAAGVHPLYAIGGAGAAFGSSPAVGVGNPGVQQSNTSGQLHETPDERQLRVAQMESLRASSGRDQSQAAYYSAMAAVERQKLNPGPRTLLGPNPESGQGDVVIPSWDVNNPSNIDAVKLQADPTISTRSGDQSMGASERKPFWSEYQITPDGFRMSLPWTQEGPGEALENVSWWMWPSVIRMNQSRYGGDWLGQFIQQVVLGKAPEYRHAGSHAISDPVLRSSGRDRGVNWRRPNRETSYQWNVK